MLFWKIRKYPGRILVTIVLLALMLTVIGCTLNEKNPPEVQGTGGQGQEVILATTTSTYDTGLLDVLLPDFEQKTGYKVAPVAVGTGAALEMGKQGNADVLLVHAPDSEMPLVESGDVINRQLVMHNDFVIVGPAADPAGLKGTGNAVEALKLITQKKVPFVSRGDDSGTDKKEKALWKEAGIEPGGNWYIETGKGMGDTLTIASEEGSYTLTDRGTYLALQRNLELEILVEGDEGLKNIYHVMQVNPEKHEGIKQEGAKAFVDFMLSKEVQQIIANFGADKYGQPLFFADALK